MTPDDSATPEATIPDPPHVREDYREVWASGYRAALAALRHEGETLRQARDKAVKELDALDKDYGKLLAESTAELRQSQDEAQANWQSVTRLTGELSALTAAQAQQDMWIVTDFDGGGIRGIFRTQDAATAEIAAVIREHPDLSRRDFVIQVERIRDASGGG